MTLPSRWPTAILYRSLIGTVPFERPPSGVTVHHTADADVTRVLRGTTASHIGYHLVIDRQGTVYQTSLLTDRVDHAGEAMWRGMSPNRHHLAVALISWGRLKMEDGVLRNAYGGEVPMNGLVVSRPGNVDGATGYWHKATDPQEAALEAVLRKLMELGRITAENICGHDECALPAGRKDDPGGVLSITMAAYREKLSTLSAPSPTLVSNYRSL